MNFLLFINNTTHTKLHNILHICICLVTSKAKCNEYKLPIYLIAEFFNPFKIFRRFISNMYKLPGIFRRG